MGVVRPAGPLPARVYWFRRAIVLGLPLVVVAVVVWIVAGRGSAATPDPGAAPQESTAAEQQTPAQTPAEQPDESEEEPEDNGGVPTCGPESLALSITATAESFPAGSSPTFLVTITNTGSVPCVVDAGDAEREIVITSGVDRVWSSKDCPDEATQTRRLLLADGAADESTLAWNRVRSAQGCPADQPSPGAGTYSAAFTLAGATATPVVFGLG